MSDDLNSMLKSFSSELESALASPNRNDFIQMVGAAIRGLGTTGLINDELSLNVCKRMWIGEK